MNAVTKSHDEPPLTLFEKFCVGILILFVGACFAFFCGGCVSTYKGGKAVDGFDAEIAVKPSSESQFTIQFAHILSGFVFYWEANDSVTMTRETTSKWSMFGVFDGENRSVTKVKVEPCETQPTGDAVK